MLYISYRFWDIQRQK